MCVAWPTLSWLHVARPAQRGPAARTYAANFPDTLSHHSLEALARRTIARVEPVLLAAVLPVNLSGAHSSWAGAGAGAKESAGESAGRSGPPCAPLLRERAMTA